MMDDVYLLLCTSLTIFLTFLIHKFSARRRYHLPPSPAVALPVLGHLHLIKPPLQRCFLRLSQTTGGPIFSLKLGVRRCVVVSSPSLVEECFTKNDVVLAARPRVLVTQHIGYNHRTLVGCSYGELWRISRRITSQELLSPFRLNSFLHIRRDEINRLLLSLCNTPPSERGFSRVSMRPKLSELTFNVMMRMIAGRKCLSREEGERFRDLIKESIGIADGSNPQDFLPFLQWIDYGGFTKKLASMGKELDELLQKVVDEHREEKMNTMIGHLLSMQISQPQIYSDQTIKALILSSLFAGTDTSSVTIEWAMSALLNHPRVLEKARSELETKVGFDRLMNEEDLANLPYLHNIILETLRMFPAAPLLIAHESSEDCRVGEYDIPRGTMVFINAWAIHRDPKVWDEAMRFKPERFEGKYQVETDHKLMPFGMGRRSCPGASLAHRVVGMALGSMIQCFEWERVGLEEVDLVEGEGLTMPKLEPLEVMCKPRETMCRSVIQELIKDNAITS